MEFELSLQSCHDLSAQNGLKREILSLNEKSAEYGLVLTEKDAEMLIACGRDALKAEERVEFGASPIPALAEKFMTSSYLSQGDYAETLVALTELFYQAKEESLDALTDEEVIDIMYDFFEMESGGSVELLRERDMDVLCRRVRMKAMNIDTEDE